MTEALIRLHALTGRAFASGYFREGNVKRCQWHNADLSENLDISDVPIMYLNLQLYDVIHIIVKVHRIHACAVMMRMVAWQESGRFIVIRSRKAKRRLQCYQKDRVCCDEME